LKSLHNVLFALDFRDVPYVKSWRTSISPNVRYWEPWTRQSATQSRDNIHNLGTYSLSTLQRLSCGPKRQKNIPRGVSRRKACLYCRWLTLLTPLTIYSILRALWN